MLGMNMAPQPDRNRIFVLDGHLVLALMTVCSQAS